MPIVDISQWILYPNILLFKVYQSQINCREYCWQIDETEKEGCIAAGIEHITLFRCP
jgi:hypothetical protein